MSRTTKPPLSRLALRIAESAACNHSRSVAEAVCASGRKLESRWETVLSQQERTTKAIDRGWFLAARRLLSEGRFDRDDWLLLWESHCRAVDGFLHSSTVGLTMPELHIELRELTEEFEDVNWDQRWLWVNTEPVTLEGVYLGPFQIKLALDRIGSPACAGDDFEVVALEPNPAGANQEVTHPHVSDGCLCQGDATRSIQLALEQGRLVDFFQLVHSVLRTYNPDSPFVRLDAWDGVCCGDCGTSVASGETSYCEACGEDYCSDCSSRCLNCDETRCAACLVECRGCRESLCSGCLSACEGCGTKGFCNSCLVACAQCERKELCADCLEYDSCASCRDEQAKEDDDANDNRTDQRETADVAPDATVELPAGGADVGVHADGLAETPVPVPCR